MSLNNILFFNHVPFLKGLRLAGVVTVLAAILAFTGRTVFTPQLYVSGNGTEVTPDNVSATLLNLTNFGVIKGDSTFSSSIVLEHDFAITNNGDSPLTISNVSLVNYTLDPFFSIVESPAFTILPGETEMLTIGLSRVAFGVAVAGITITSDDPDNPGFSFYIKAVSQYCEDCENERQNWPLCNACLPQFDPDTFPACDACVNTWLTPDCDACVFPQADYGTFCTTCINPDRNPPRCQR